MPTALCQEITTVVVVVFAVVLRFYTSLIDRWRCWAIYPPNQLNLYKEECYSLSVSTKVPAYWTETIFGQEIRNS